MSSVARALLGEEAVEKEVAYDKEGEGVLGGGDGVSAGTKNGPNLSVNDIEEIGLTG